MPYVLKESKQLALVAMDLPNPPPELKDAVNAVLRVMKHPLAVPIEVVTETFSANQGNVTATTGDGFQSFTTGGQPIKELSISAIKEGFKRGKR